MKTPELVIEECITAGVCLAYADMKFPTKSLEWLSFINEILDTAVAKPVHINNPISKKSVFHRIAVYADNAAALDRLQWETKHGVKVNAEDIDKWHAINIVKILEHRKEHAVETIIRQHGGIKTPGLTIERLDHNLIHVSYWLCITKEILPAKFKKEEAASIIDTLLSEDEVNDKFNAFKAGLNGT